MVIIDSYCCIRYKEFARSQLKQVAQNNRANLCTKFKSRREVNYVYNVVYSVAISKYTNTITIL